MPTGLQDREDQDSLNDERNPGQAHYNEQVSDIDPDYVRDGLRDLENHANDASQSDNSSPESSSRGVGKQSKRDKETQALKNLDEGRQERAKAARGKANEGKSFLSKIGSRFKGSSRRKKAIIGGVLGTGLIGGAVAFFSIFGIFNVFRLDHLLSNLEAKGFIRYQVDMEGRSSKWISAYMALRMGEVDGPEAPQDRDNIFFRAERVDNNSPLTDWYKTMRASKFENELFDKHGIAFTSVAKREGNRIVFRSGIMRVGDQHTDIKITENERRIMEGFMNGSGDVPRTTVNQFTNNIRSAVNVTEFENDRDARRQIKTIVKENTHWYQVMKRFYVRKSIQNMTGVRDWRFFEKTRDKVSDKTIDVRNKFLVKALPESTKSGKFIGCLFGLVTCPRSSDPNDVQNRDTSNGTTTNIDISDSDDGSKLTSKITSQLLTKFNIVTGATGMISTLDTVDKAVRSGALSTGIYTARAAQAMGIFTMGSIARDQARSGELTAEEMNSFMDVTDGAGTSEAWNKIIETEGDDNRVSAATMSPAKDKKEYCSHEHQEAMLRAENKQVAASEYHWLCDSEKIGGAKAAATIESGWENSIGFVLRPFFEAYNKSGLVHVFDFFNGALDAVTGPLINGTLKALGLNDNVKDFATWALNKIGDLLGAGPQVDSNAPSGVIVNHMMMGATASAETAARYQGAARTTAETAARSTRAVAAYQAEEKENQSIGQRYFALSNPKSLLSGSLFAVSNSKASTMFGSFVSSILKAPASLLTTRAQAAGDDTYAAADFAGVNTYDFPKQCTDTDVLDPDVTPQTSTNADDLGLINSSDLTWELVRDSDAFYGKLYENAGSDSNKIAAIDTVYDCAILDATVSGALGALYGVDAGPNSIDAATAADGSTSSGGTTDPATPGKGYVGADGFGGGSCVDYVKYILARHSSRYKGGSTGDGKDVARNLGGLGYVVNNTPAVHAVVSFPTSMANPVYGHVALVAEILPDGSIIVEEANWTNPNQYGTHKVAASDVGKLTYAHTEDGWH